MTAWLWLWRRRKRWSAEGLNRRWWRSFDIINKGLGLLFALFVVGERSLTMLAMRVLGVTGDALVVGLAGRKEEARGSWVCWDWVSHSWVAGFVVEEEEATRKREGRREGGYGKEKEDLFHGTACPRQFGAPNVRRVCSVSSHILNAVKVNGFVCKDAANATAEDFFFTGLAKPGLTNNTFGSLVTLANVEKIPGLNTLGVSLARIDYAPGGINPPHTHPRATEIVYVLEGELDVGFITTANKLIRKTTKQGEVFVFPKGLVHFQNNNGKSPASMIAAFNSQLQGRVKIALTLFAATPEVPENVLTKTFQVGTKQVDKIKSKLAPKA
ncbi:rhicadhesin receptor-like [Malus sylvestris]|uniref:rhicadhesin receptor-like n=1 Tax=Malus sylvestris TaxID=3752 RepID=UPI0021AC6039|nr:rhicadhesin receptor-like [Malus sylvestris]